MTLDTVIPILYYSLINKVIDFLPSIFMVIIKLCKIKYYSICNLVSETETISIISYIKKNGYYCRSTIVESNLTPSNTLFVCFQPFYIGYIDNYISDRTHNSNIHIFTFNDIKNITKSKMKKDNVLEDTDVKIFEPIGTASWSVSIQNTSTYNKPFFIPHKNIITNIINTYILNKQNKIINNNYLGCLFYGNPGCGKSSIGFNIAHSMKSIIVNNYDPTILGLSIITFLMKQDMDNDKPIVIVINEFDKIIDSCYNEKLETKTEYLRDAWSKTSLNNLIDKLTMKNGIILICTTNKDISWFHENNYDSTIREGRFNITKKIDKLERTEINELKTLGYKCNGYLNKITKI